MTESEALLAIQDILDGTEWSVDLCWDIALVLRQAGYEVGADDRA